MDDRELKFTDTYSLSKVGDDIELCQIKFEVRQFSSEKDNLYISQVRVVDIKDFTLIQDFKFEVFNGESRSHHINDYIFPKRLRGSRIAMFILNTVYGYLSEEVIDEGPLINGRLVEEDKAPNRDHMYKKLIGFYNGHLLAKFTVDNCGGGEFSGVFHNVGDNWTQSLKATFLSRV